MTSLDLIKTAQDLIEAAGRGRPRQANLRRAVSTTYYALFHCLAACCADMTVGSARSNRSAAAWQQAYRALEHGTARRRCRAQTIKDFLVEIQDFAGRFVDIQDKRHNADYNPEGIFHKPTVVQDIVEAEQVIGQFHRVPTKDRRAFAVYVLLNIRNS